MFIKFIYKVILSFDWTMVIYLLFAFEINTVFKFYKIPLIKRYENRLFRKLLILDTFWQNSDTNCIQKP